MAAENQRPCIIDSSGGDGGEEFRDEFVEFFGSFSVNKIGGLFGTIRSVVAEAMDLDASQSGGTPAVAVNHSRSSSPSADDIIIAAPFMAENYTA